MSTTPPNDDGPASRSARSRTGIINILLTLCACVAVVTLILLINTEESTVDLSPEERQYLLDHPVMRVGIDDSFTPLQYQDKKGHARGFSVDFMNLVSVNLGVTFEYIPAKWSQLSGMLQSGEIDIIPDMTPTERRAQFYAFTDPVSDHQTHLFVQAHVVDVETPADLHGRRIAIPKGTALAALLRRTYPEADFMEFTDSNVALQGLLKGHYAAVAAYDFAFNYAIFQAGVSDVKATGPALTREHGCLAVRKENAVLHSILSKGVMSIREEQKENIQRKWVGSVPYHRPFPFLLERYSLELTIAAALVIAVALWNLLLQIGFRRKTAAIREMTARFSILYQNTHEAVFILQRRTIVDMNPVAERLLSVRADDVTGQDIFDIVPSATFVPGGVDFRAAYAKAEQGTPQSVEAAIALPSGRNADIEARLSAFTVQGQNYIVAQVRDITERKIAERGMRKQRTLLQQLFEHSPLAVVRVDRSVTVLDVNHAFEMLFGYPREDAIGRHLDSLIVAPDKVSQADGLNQAILLGETVQHETTRRTRTGADVHVSIAASPITFEGEYIGSYCIYADITQRYIAEEQLRYQAYYDRLTGLPNRERLIQHLQGSIAAPHPFALLHLDLDRFKVINDSLGHPMGNMVIKAMANRLKVELPQDCFISRVAGDEFAIVLHEKVDAESARATARRIQSIIRRPMTLAGREIQPSAGIGLVLGPPEHENPDFMLRDAEIALYQAKSAGMDKLAVFTQQMHTQAMQALETEAELRRAVDNEEFILYYQPIIQLTTGALAGFEALVRWQHPQYGIIEPSAFIHTAEETGLIVGLGQQVLDMACAHLATLQHHYPDTPLFMSVNLSSHQFTLPDLSERIRATATAAGARMSSIKLEITESAVMENAHTAEYQLDMLRRLGVSLSLDDFGTGYSSLSYLQDFTLHTVKVDRSFVQRIGPEGQNAEIIRAIIEMAHILNMDVIAEGVEHPYQAAILRRFGCDYAQGYLYARPMPQADVDAYIDEKRQFPVVPAPH
ncbi:EAL domain-containing protein [Desulfobaculum sp. SPO524]|uniref:EAL domain-containing protein n=1 Tax=Desulfobaculum sp. SPO524 TaxID=3378071 RepID=UPI0038538757